MGAPKRFGMARRIVEAEGIKVSSRRRVRGRYRPGECSCSTASLGREEIGGTKLVRESGSFVVSLCFKMGGVSCFIPSLLEARLSLE